MSAGVNDLFEALGPPVSAVGLLFRCRHCEHQFFVLSGPEPAHFCPFCSGAGDSDTARRLHHGCNGHTCALCDSLIVPPPPAEPTPSAKPTPPAVSKGIPIRLHDDGLVVVPHTRSRSGWICVVIVSGHPSYPVGGYDILVTDDELRAGQRVDATS